MSGLASSMYPPPFEAAMGCAKSPQQQAIALRQLERLRSLPRSQITTCEVCGETLPTRYALFGHLQVSSGLKKPCRGCGEIFTRDKDLRDHKCSAAAPPKRKSSLLVTLPNSQPAPKRPRNSTPTHAGGGAEAEAEALSSSHSHSHSYAKRSGRPDSHTASNGSGGSHASSPSATSHRDMSATSHLDMSATSHHGLSSSISAHDYQRLYNHRNSHRTPTNGASSFPSSSAAPPSNGASSNSRTADPGLVVVGHVVPEWPTSPVSGSSNNSSSSSHTPHSHPHSHSSSSARHTATRAHPLAASVNSSSSYAIGGNAAGDSRRPSLAAALTAATASAAAAAASSPFPVDISPRSHPMAAAVASAVQRPVAAASSSSSSGGGGAAGGRSSRTSRDRSSSTVASSSSSSGKKRRAPSYSASRQNSPSNFEGGSDAVQPPPGARQKLSAAARFQPNVYASSSAPSNAEAASRREELMRELREMRDLRRRELRKAKANAVVLESCNHEIIELKEELVALSSPQPAPKLDASMSTPPIWPAAVKTPADQLPPVARTPTGGGNLPPPLEATHSVHELPPLVGGGDRLPPAPAPAPRRIDFQSSHAARDFRHSVPHGGGAGEGRGAGRGAASPMDLYYPKSLGGATAGSLMDLHHPRSRGGGATSGSTADLHHSGSRGGSYAVATGSLAHMIHSRSRGGEGTGAGRQVDSSHSRGGGRPMDPGPPDLRVDLSERLRLSGMVSSQRSPPSHEDDLRGYSHGGRPAPAPSPSPPSSVSLNVRLPSLPRSAGSASVANSQHTADGSRRRMSSHGVADGDHTGDGRKMLPSRKDGGGVGNDHKTGGKTPAHSSDRKTGGGGGRKVLSQSPPRPSFQPKRDRDADIEVLNPKRDRDADIEMLNTLTCSRAQRRLLVPIYDFLQEKCHVFAKGDTGWIFTKNKEKIRERERVALGVFAQELWKCYPHLRLQDSGAPVLNRTLKSVVRSVGESLYGWDEDVMKYFSMQRILLGIRWKDAMYTDEIVARQKLGWSTGKFTDDLALPNSHLLGSVSPPRVASNATADASQFDSDEEGGDGVAPAALPPSATPNALPPLSSPTAAGAGAGVAFAEKSFADCTKEEKESRVQYGINLWKLGSSMRVAANVVDVPWTTFRRRAMRADEAGSGGGGSGSGSGSGGNGSGPSVHGGRRAPAALDAHLEQNLAKDMSLRVDLGFGVTNEDLLSAISSYGLKGSRNWCSAFMERHPELLARATYLKGNSRGRKASVADVSKRFYCSTVPSAFEFIRARQPDKPISASQLSCAEHRETLPGTFDTTPPYNTVAESNSAASTTIITFDELRMELRDGELILQDAQFNSSKASSNTSRSTSSLLAAVRADGSTFPPFFNFQGDHRNDDCLKNSIRGTNYTVTSAAAQNEESMMGFAKHLVENRSAEISDDAWSVAFFNGSLGYEQLRHSVWTYLAKNRILGALMPAHLSKALKARGYSIFGDFRTKFHSEILKASKPVTSPWDIPSAIAHPFRTGFSSSSLVRGFSRMGIWPHEKGFVDSHQSIFDTTNDSDSDDGGANSNGNGANGMDASKDASHNQRRSRTPEQHPTSSDVGGDTLAVAGLVEP